MRRVVALLISGCLSLMVDSIPAAAADVATSWHDSFVTRLEALALLQTLNSDLLSHASATLTLEGWCATHHLASPAQVVAELVKDGERPPTAAMREQLRVSDTERVRYRHVRLRCGERVLSEAENWYIPGRLTPDMNRLLETTDIAFGRVVQTLQFRRQTLEATLIWSPLPLGWESAPPAQEGLGSSKRLELPPNVLRHRALLVLPEGLPISDVIETYTSAVLAFPEPSTARRTSAPQRPSAR